jgi:hypothetical protein
MEVLSQKRLKALQPVRTAYSTLSLYLYQMIPTGLLKGMLQIPQLLQMILT